MTAFLWVVFGALAVGIAIQGAKDWWYIVVGLPVVTGFYWGIAWLLRNNP